MSKGQTANRLRLASSPYLRQHAGNPVEWYAWGEEALAEARRRDCPILLSIGYSACHWCHVMAHESFEDAGTAALMNRLFVNVKVDREERPDLDRIYQTAHQILTHAGGGWPLTVFLTPDDQLPFFAGTYFPPRDRHGLPAFRTVLERVDAAWREQRDALRAQNSRMADALAQLAGVEAPADTPLETAPVGEAREALAARFDPDLGGFGKAPKFPQAPTLAFLLERYARENDREALHMACTTLRRMALGGINDQVGGGFARYSVDAWWMIPHFEKMLCDNGLLVSLYSRAFQATGDAFFARVARETADWITGEMRHPGGGFHSALDADSQGEEGRYFTWTPGEVRRLLDDEEYALVERRFGLDDAPNFEGRWHFHVYASVSELGKHLRRPREEVLKLLQSARRKLYRARSRRVPPGLDNKILTSWNALAIDGLALAGRLLEEPALVDRAEEAWRFLRDTVCAEDRVRCHWTDGRLSEVGFLDDTACLLAATLQLLQSRWLDEGVTLARRLADDLLADFQADSGAFHLTARDHEPLAQRPLATMDDATPAGAAVAIRGLHRLGCLLAEPRYLEAADRGLRATWNQVAAQPLAHLSLLQALEDHLHSPVQVILRGPDDTLGDWRRRLERHFRPGMAVYSLPAGAGDNEPALREKAASGAARAWICRGTRCAPPAESLEGLLSELGLP